MACRFSPGLRLILFFTRLGTANPIRSLPLELNSLLDAVEAAIRNVTPGIAQSLGGKVSHCRIEGKIEIIENVVGSMALAVVPIEILTTA